MKKIVAVALLGTLLCSFAYANQLTTYQKWSFSNGSNPAVLDEVDNPFGTPTLSLCSGIWLQSYSGAMGVWRILSTGGVNIAIPNTTDNSPDSWKEITLQITYRDPGSEFGVDVPIVSYPLYESLALADRQIQSNGYYKDTYSIIISPNPSEEFLDLYSIQYAIYIDEISIGTVCVPEPATMALLSLGGLLLRKKR
ncbi:MAG: PEP-CTERM sorting domain-containing protein [Phycisphaerae bacterium]|nr:PEP-CTERM sorting domain-containing protein [Phycisphaerae bacterium]